MEKENNIIAFRDPKSNVSEAFRTLRTNVQFASMNEEVKTILVTSSCAGEGKSTVSANLATVFAQQKKKVLLIDADMRCGRLSECFDIENKMGLSNYLANIDFVENELINATYVDNLYLITAGRVPPNPSELLSSGRMKSLLTQAKGIYDVVIVDGPPCMVVADGLILAKLVDSTVIVSAFKETHKDALKNTKKALENIGAKVGGVVLNKVSNDSSGYYSNYTYNSYYYGSRK